LNKLYCTGNPHVLRLYAGKTYNDAIFGLKIHIDLCISSTYRQVYTALEISSNCQITSVITKGVVSNQVL